MPYHSVWLFLICNFHPESLWTNISLKITYVQNYYPSPNFKTTDEIVDLVIAKLDKEWLQEQTQRGGPEFPDCIQFAECLPYMQKLALVEALITIFPTWPDRLVARAHNSESDTQSMQPVDSNVIFDD